METRKEYYINQIKRAYEGTPNINEARKYNIGYISGIYDANGIGIFDIGQLLSLNDNLYKKRGGKFDEL